MEYLNNYQQTCTKIKGYRAVLPQNTECWYCYKGRVLILQSDYILWGVRSKLMCVSDIFEALEFGNIYSVINPLRSGGVFITCLSGPVSFCTSSELFLPIWSSQLSWPLGIYFPNTMFCIHGNGLLLGYFLYSVLTPMGKLLNYISNDGWAGGGRWPLTVAVRPDRTIGAEINTSYYEIYCGHWKWPNKCEWLSFILWVWALTVIR